MVLVHNRYKNNLVTHSSHSRYVTLRTQVIRLNSGNLGSQKIDSPAGTIRWNNVEFQFGTTSRPNFNYNSTLFQCKMPAGSGIFIIISCAFSHRKLEINLQESIGILNNILYYINLDYCHLIGRVRVT